MPKFSPFLTCSLAANLLLVVGWTLSVRRSAPVVAVAAASLAPPAEAAAMCAGPSEAGEPGAEWPNWIASIRALGVPNALLARLVQADFAERWERRSRALELRRAAGEIDDEEAARELGDHDEEQARELRAALGEAGFAAWEKDQVLRAFSGANPPLTEAEGEQLYRLQKESEAKRRELTAAHARGEIDAVALDTALEALEETHASEVKSVLGESRVGSGDLADDAARVKLRRQFKTLNMPADQIEKLADLDQARALLEKGLDQSADGAGQSDRGREAERLAVTEARDRAFERVVGPEAFQAWQRMTDPRWEALQKYAPAWNLSAAEAGRVYALLQQRDAAVRERQLQALASQPGGSRPDWPAVQREVDTQARTTADSLRQLLGSERFQRMEQNGVFAPR